MNEVQFKFTLNNTTSGIQQIEEPIGWDDAFLKLERDRNFHGVVEFYDQPLTFPKGDDLPGGFDYIKNVFDTEGADADITVTVYISNDEGVSYDEVFSGLLDLSTYTNIEQYKIQCNILRNDLWSKFQNRKGTSINVKSSTDLDGSARSTLSSKTLSLPSQTVRTQFARNDNYDPDNLGLLQTGSGAGGTTSYLLFSNSYNTLDEISERFDYGVQVTSTLPTTDKKYIFKAKYPGTYAVDVTFRYHITLSASRTFDIKCYFARRQNGTLTATQVGTTHTGTLAVIPDDGAKTLSTSVTLAEGDELYFYITVGLSSATTMLTYFADYDSDPGLPVDVVYTSLEITADTTYKDSEAEAMLIHESFQSVLDRLVGANNTLYSSYLGRANTQGRTYGSSGCASNYALCRGVHLRGYSFSDKILSFSFDDLWAAANPIFNLGLQYRTISGTELIEILHKDDLYESDSSITLNYVNYLEETVDTVNTFKSIKIGYEKWEAEDYSGIDDPQTKREYATPLKKIGEEITLYSKAIAASLAIESTRRQGIEKGADYKLDNDLFIIALDESDLASSIYTPDLDDDFSSVSGLLNATTRYNLKLTPGRNFLRWYKYFNGAFYDLYSSSTYKFVYGEGNYAMLSTQTGSCPEAGTLDEDGNITMGTEAGYHSNKMLEFEHPLSWDEYKTIRDNKNKKIMVSSTNANHDACYIDSIEYQLTKGIAKFKLWKV